MRAASDHLIAVDGVRLPTRAWLPDADADARAALLFVHGFAEHIGRYDALATRMVAAGFAVHGYDQRGHGYAQGPRGQVRRFEQLLDDLAQVAAAVRAWHPDVPLVLFGHSMGGVVAARAVETERVHPDLLVLSSPVLRDGMAVPGWLRTLLVRLAEIVPDLPTVRVDPTALSRDAGEVAAYVQDPAVFHGPIKARIGLEMAKHGALALVEADRLRLPVLIVHGKDDRIAEPGAAGELQRALAGRDATLLLYDQGLHELFNDALRDRVTADVLAWLDERLTPDARTERRAMAVSADGRRGPPRT